MLDRRRYRALIVFAMLSTPIQLGVVFGQVTTGGAGRPGIGGGARFGIGGARFGPGGFQGPAVNPNFNPPGSLSPFQRFNPPGSMSPALNFNPPGSAFRPHVAPGIGGPIIGGSRARAFVGSGRQVPIPTVQQMKILPLASLRAWASYGAGQLDGALGQTPNGQLWKEHLDLEGLQSALAGGSQQQENDDDTAVIERTYQRMHTATLDEQYRRVTQLRGFEVLHVTLRELSSTGADDGWSRLVRSADALDRQLQRISTGAGWKNYLALSQEDDEPDASGDDVPSASRERLDRALSRFDAVAQNSDYRAIWSIPEFQATHANLAAYVEHTDPGHTRGGVADEF